MKHLATIAALMLAGTATADEFTYGSWVPAGHGVMVHGVQPFLDEVAEATGGETTWTMLAGGQVVKGNTTLAGLRDGLIDGGFVIAPYTPSDLPATNMIFNTLVFGDDIVAAAGAMNEAVMLHCPQCLAEAKANNAVFLAGYAASPYVLICTRPVATLEDVQGLKVRASGGGVNVMEIAGATPVAMSPAEATTALQKGAIDCVLGAPAWLKSYGYQDVAKHVLDYPFGMGGPAMHLVLGRNAWDAMDDATKAAHIAAAPASIARATLIAYVQQDAEVVEVAKAAGVSFVKGGEDFAAVAAEREANQRAANIASAEEFGVENAEAVMAAFEEALVKWKGLSAEIGGDVDKFAEALDREIYQKLDPSAL